MKVQLGLLLVLSLALLTESTSVVRPRSTTLPPIAGGMDEGPVPRQPILGGHVKADKLGEIELGVVHFALANLAGGGEMGCPRHIIKVENFTTKVVSGMLYNFDVVLGSPPELKAGCPRVSPQKCHMSVTYVEWTKKRTVNWGKVACSQVAEDLGQTSQSNLTPSQIEEEEVDIPRPGRARRPGIDTGKNARNNGGPPVHASSGDKQDIMAALENSHVNLIAPKIRKPRINKKGSL